MRISTLAEVRMQRFIGMRILVMLILGVASASWGKTYAQCGLQELVKGADKYNELVCQASTASRTGDDKKALDLLLEAAGQPVLESPNIRLFGLIAETYAKLGHFDEAIQNLKYDNLSILWMIGIVRCHASSDSTNEVLYQDGEPLVTVEGKHMAGILCGPVFDENSYFRDRNAESFIPAARAILRHAALHTEIDRMRNRRISNQH